MEGEPRIYDSMSVLENGRIIVPFFVLSDGQQTSGLGLLTSLDGGTSWETTRLGPEIPLAWWVPCGKVLELPGRILVMPIFGAVSPEQVRATIHGMTNRTEEAPLPPYMPFLGDRWPFEHYGFPSILALDDQSLIVVFARTQNGKGHNDWSWDLPEWKGVPVDRERIQAVLFRRAAIEAAVDEPRPKASAPETFRGRWVLVERMVVEDVGAFARDPGGDLIGQVQGGYGVRPTAGERGRKWKAPFFRQIEWRRSEFCGRVAGWPQVEKRTHS